MRILLMANNWGGWQVAKWLGERNEDMVGLVTHHPYNAKFDAEIAAACLELSQLKLLCWANKLHEPATLKMIRALEPDIGICAFFGYILKPELIEIFPQGCINLHPSYLPYNRGWHPNVYPFLDGTPAGVSIHYVDEGVDTGDIIARRRVDVEPFDTGGTLHQRLTRELVELFKDTWPAIKDGTASRTPQGHQWLPTHKRHRMRLYEHINLSGRYEARYLLGLLRGLTYPPYPAAYYEEDGKRVYVRVELFGEDDLEEGALPEWY